MRNRLFADVSDSNPRFVLGDYRRSGSFCIAIKATEGETFVNPVHGSWTRAAHQVGISVFHYHFARPDLHPSVDGEVRNFLNSTIPRTGPHDFLVLDYERYTTGNDRSNVQWINEFCRQVRAHSRFHPILYTDQSDLTRFGAGGALSGRRVWVAAWGTQPLTLPGGVSLWARQFTDGRVGPEPHALPGVGQCDVSRLSWATFAYLTAARIR